MFHGSITYATFEIVVGQRTEGGYPVRVRPTETVSPARGILDLDPTDDRLRRLVNEIEEEDPHRRGKALLAEFGERLFERLFTGEVAASFHESWGRARTAGRGLRLRLDLEPPELASLPWEYLYHAAEDHFFAVAADTPLTRFVSDLHQPLEPLTVEGRLRMLLITASPEDVVPLDLAAGRGNIAEALADVPGIELLPPVDQATPSAVREALRRHHPHIVHFLGHGYFQRADGGERAGVVLEDGSGRACRLDADEFARLFQAPPGAGKVRLLVLNACEGAKASSTRPLVGLAHNALRHVPAVVAMQYPVYDDAARRFASEFYRALAVGYPVDAAVSEARNALYIDYGAGRRDWGIPALFLRSPDGRIFHVVEERDRTFRPADDAGRLGFPADVRIDPDNPPIAAIRELLLIVFNPEDLRRFCQDRSIFQPLVARFGPGHGLDDMVDRVIDYCRTQLLWDELLAEVAKSSPRHYARFEPRLRGSDRDDPFGPA